MSRRDHLSYSGFRDYTPLLILKYPPGHCQKCGKPDAAPYWQCADCRALASINRTLKKLERGGIAVSERGSGRGRPYLWRAGPRINEEYKDHVPSPLWGEGKGAEDRRTWPRVGGKPVHPEALVMSLFELIGKPMTLNEIERACMEWKARYR